MTQKTKVLRLFTSELLDHEGNPNGIHIGCDDLQVCKQFHIENKTSQSIQEWVAVEELHATVVAREDEIQTHSAAVYECTRLLSEVRTENASLAAALASSCDEQRLQLWGSGNNAGCERAKVMSQQVQQTPESIYHPCTFILIKGLKELKAWDVLAEWDKAREIVDKRFRAAIAAVKGEKK